MRLEDGQRSSDFRTGLVALEMVGKLIAGDSLSATAQQVQDCVGG
jgi:hypothetical protein